LAFRQGWKDLFRPTIDDVRLFESQVFAFSSIDFSAIPPATPSWRDSPGFEPGWLVDVARRLHLAPPLGERVTSAGVSRAPRQG
jgi:hypothetical protein